MALAAARLLEPNLIDGAVLTASSQVATLPVTHLANPLRRRVWRSAGAGTPQTIAIDLGRAETAAALAFTNHNLSLGARARLEANDLDAWEAPAWRSDWWDVHESLWGYGLGGWGEHGCGGFLLDGEAEGYLPIFAAFFAERHHRWWRLTLDDPDNPDGCCEMGRLFLGTYYEPQRGFGYDYQVHQVDPSVVGYSLGQAPFSSVREKYFRVVLPFGQMEIDEFHHALGDRLRRLGTTRDFFLLLFPLSDAPAAQLLRFYGRLERMPEWSVWGHNRGRLRLEFRESR